MELKSILGDVSKVATESAGRGIGLAGLGGIAAAANPVVGGALALGGLLKSIFSARAKRKAEERAAGAKAKEAEGAAIKNAADNRTAILSQLMRG